MTATTEQFPPAPRTELERLASQVVELQDLLAQAERDTARALDERDGMRERVSEPNGCAHCGVPKRGHGRRYVLGAGWHAWERPTDEQVKTRMLARRAARQLLEAVPLIVARYDTAMEHAPEEVQGVTVGAIDEHGRPVALVFDPETRVKVAEWLAPTTEQLLERVAELEAELARVKQPSYSNRHVWSVWQEGQPIHAHYATIDDARQGSIDCWEEDEPSCPDYSWKPDGPRLELLVGGEASGVYISRADVFGTLADPEKELAEARAELAKYVGHEPTIADEMAYLSRCLDAVRDVCDDAEKQATRWEQPLPVPEWVAKVRSATDGLEERRSYPPALPWAQLMDDEDLHDFLGDLIDALHSDRPTTLEVLAEVEKTCASHRAIAEAQHAHNTAAGPNAEMGEGR